MPPGVRALTALTRVRGEASGWRLTSSAKSSKHPHGAVGRRAGRRAAAWGRAVDAAGLLELSPDDRLLGLQLGLTEELVRPEEVLLLLFEGCVPGGGCRGR